MHTYTPTKAADFRIRTTTEADVELIASFIHQLAEYEKLLHEITATPDDLRRSLFEQPVAQAVIGEYQGQPVGFAVFFHNFSTFKGRPGLYLEDLFVLPTYRGRGFGTAFLAYLAAVAIERGCARFEWSVLDWNEPSIQFYQHMGARMLHDWRIMRVSDQALHQLAQR